MARIRQQDIDALRERADIVDIVSGYTKLKKSGGHTFKGLCPFHSEKTPSFSVDAAKGLTHCFGCGEGGDVYSFVGKIESLPFPEAVEWVARKMGFDLTYEEMSPGDVQRAGVKARVIQANEAAAGFFHDALMKAPEALDARRYLERRGFGPDAARRWNLGYAPGRDGLYKHLLAKGFNAEELRTADLVRRSDRDGSFYDTFRQRIIFPTWNLHGDVVGFGARKVHDDQPGPKYLNSAETPAFSKSRVMFGLDRAKSAIARGNALVVEGYTDVIALHEAGITEAVATNGVALGETHFELLKKFTERVVLMLDADTAGQGATERSFDVHHKVGIDVLVAPLPAGRDPADVAKEDGDEGIRKVVEAARPLLEFKLEQTLAKLPLDTPETRARAIREAATVLGWHPDPIARHQYVSMVAERIGVEPDGIQRALSDELSGAASRAGGEQTSRVQDRRLPGHVKVEREALQLLLSQPAATAEAIDGIDRSHFTSPPRYEVFSYARKVIDEGRSPLDAGAAQALSEAALSLYTELTVGLDATLADLTARSGEIFTRLRVFCLERDIKARRDTLQDVNPVDEPERYDELFTDLVKLEAARRDLLRRLQGED